MTENQKDRCLAQAYRLLTQCRALFQGEDAGLIDVRRLLDEMDDTLECIMSGTFSLYRLCKSAACTFQMTMDQRAQELEIQLPAGFKRLSWTIPTVAVQEKLEDVYDDWRGTALLRSPSYTETETRRLQLIVWIGALLMEAERRARELAFMDGAMVVAHRERLTDDDEQRTN